MSAALRGLAIAIARGGFVAAMEECSCFIGGNIAKSVGYGNSKLVRRARKRSPVFNISQVINQT
jgi:hypothetical protein